MPSNRGGRRGRGGGRRAKGAGARGGAVRVKTARKRRVSSTRWLQRQLTDPYVAEARRSGYRSRAAFKLRQLDDRFGLLKPGARVVDLGAAPGGWTQVAVERVSPPGAAAGPKAAVVAVDREGMEPVPGAAFVQGDIAAPETRAAVLALLDGPVDVVLSDLSPAATGHAATDHLRIIALAEAAFDFAEEVLAPGGAFVAKVFHGGAEPALLARVKRRFAKVKHAKPPASRKESAEVYLVATGFRDVGAT